MRSTVVMFVLTFAVFGLLLGIAETFNTASETDSQTPNIPEEADDDNSTATNPTNSTAVPQGG